MRTVTHPLWQTRIWVPNGRIKGQKFGKLITVSTFCFSFKSGSAKGLRFELKEKQCLKEMEYGARGHLNKFVH